MGNQAKPGIEYAPAALIGFTGKNLGKMIVKLAQPGSKGGQPGMVQNRKNYYYARRVLGFLSPWGTPGKEKGNARIRTTVCRGAAGGRASGRERAYFGGNILTKKPSTRLARPSMAINGNQWQSIIHEQSTTVQSQSMPINALPRRARARRVGYDGQVNYLSIYCSQNKV